MKQGRGASVGVDGVRGGTVSGHRRVKRQSVLRIRGPHDEIPTQLPKHIRQSRGRRDSMSEYVQWYNTSHKHSGIALFTPQEVHDSSWRQAHATRDLALQ